MATLSDLQKSQTRFNLVYNAGTPAGDRARLEAAMTQIQDAWTLSRIGEMITNCETAWSNRQVAAGSLVDEEKTAVTGSTIRNTTIANRPTWAQRQRDYLQETTNLARALAVRNYRDPDEAAAGYLIEGATFIKSIPGIDGATGPPGSVSLARVNFSFGDVSVLPLYLTGSNQRIVTTALILDVAFNAAVSLSIGDSGNNSRLMGAGQNYPAIAGVYQTNPAYKYSSPTQINLYKSVGTYSAGNGTIILFGE